MRNRILRRLMICAVMLFVVLPGVSMMQETTPQAPYLYYYSGILNAFVIERADGTDSRLLAQRVMPRTHRVILNPTWSPSGRWLMWRSAVAREGVIFSHYGWVISSDGAQRLTMLDHLTDGVFNMETMAWASDDDVLFVSYLVGDTNRENIVRHSMLIDADAQTILAAHTLDTPHFPDDPISFVWLPDDQGVAFLHQLYDWEERRSTVRMGLLLRDGTMREGVYSPKIILGLSPDGRLAYVPYDEHQLVIENLLDESTQVIPLPDRSPSAPERLNDQIAWHPQQNVALYYLHQAESHDLLLLDVGTQQSILLQTDVRFLAVRNPQYGNTVGSPGNWSPDGQRFVFRSVDDTHRLFELDGRSVTLLDDVPEYETIAWAENSLQLLLKDDKSLTIYDVRSQQSTQVEQVIAPEAYFMETTRSFPSPDGNYVGLTEHRILHVDSGILHTFGVHSAATYASHFINHYDWHEDSTWVIAYNSFSFAGGGGGTLASIVLNMETLRDNNGRELTVGFSYNAGWLPQRAIAHLGAGQPESVVQQPAWSYSFPQRVVGVTWNPESDSIATITSNGDVFIRNIGSSQRPNPAFRLNTRCFEGGFIPPFCSMNWESGIISVRNQAWDMEQQTYLTLDDADQVDCSRYRCIERLADAVSADGRWLAQAFDYRAVEVTDQHTGDVIERFEAYEIISFMWVGEELIIATDNGVSIFNANTGETRQLDSIPTSVIRVSPDGRLIAGASIAAPIYIREIETGELVTVLNWYAYDIAFSPDGRWLAAGNTDLVTIWEIEQMVGQGLDGQE